MRKSLKHRLAAALDRPGGRFLAGPLATVYASLRNRSPVLVTNEGVCWVHHHRSAKLVYRVIYAISPSELEAITRDTFFHYYTPRRGDVVVDIGAGVGSEALTLSRLVGDDGRVVAVEAHPGTYRCLEKLCQLNSLDNVSAKQLAIMDESGPVTISDSDADIANSVVRDVNRAIEVPGMSMDQLVESEGLSHIDFLKMNIEGAEAPAVRGMQRTLEMTQNLAISCHDFIGEERRDPSMYTKAMVREALESHGFAVAERTKDPRPWIRDTLYATRGAATNSAVEANA